LATKVDKVAGMGLSMKIMEQPKTKLGSITGSNGDNATNTKYSDQAA
jgi:hypothetical protein